MNQQTSYYRRVVCYKTAGGERSRTLIKASVWTFPMSSTPLTLAPWTASNLPHSKPTEIRIALPHLHVPPPNSHTLPDRVLASVSAPPKDQGCEVPRERARQHRTQFVIHSSVAESRTMPVLRRIKESSTNHDSSTKTPATVNAAPSYPSNPRLFTHFPLTTTPHPPLPRGDADPRVGVAGHLAVQWTDDGRKKRHRCRGSSSGPTQRWSRRSVSCLLGGVVSHPARRAVCGLACVVRCGGV